MILIDDVQQHEKRNFHRFPWKNQNFQELYKPKLEENISNFKNFHYGNSDPIQNQVDINMTNLIKIFFKSAREAEKILDTNIIKNNNLSNTKKRMSKELVIMTKQLRPMHYEDKHSNVINKSKNQEYKNLKKEIRRLQRANNFKNEKKSALNLERLLHNNKEKFWQTAKLFSK
jgi:hypothetical protein